MMESLGVGRQRWSHRRLPGAGAGSGSHGDMGNLSPKNLMILAISGFPQLSSNGVSHSRILLERAAHPAAATGQEVLPVKASVALYGLGEEQSKQQHQHQPSSGIRASFHNSPEIRGNQCSCLGDPKILLKKSVAQLHEKRSTTVKRSATVKDNAKSPELKRFNIESTIVIKK